MNADSYASRQAALALHSVDRADREWVLGQLGTQERATLLGLIDELEELGIQPDPSYRPAVLGGQQEVPRDSVAWLGARLDTVAEILADEPAFIIAHALAVFPVELHNRLLARVPLLQRSEAGRILSAGIDAESIASQTVLECLEQAVKRLPQPAPMLMQRSWARSVLDRLQQMILGWMR